MSSILKNTVKVYFTQSYFFQEISICSTNNKFTVLSNICGSFDKTNAMKHVLSIYFLTVILNIYISLGITILKPYFIFIVSLTVLAVCMFIKIHHTYTVSILWNTS